VAQPGVLALGFIQRCEVVQTRGHSGWSGQELFLELPAERGRVAACALLALGFVQACEVVQARGYIRVVRAVGLFCYSYRAFEERLGLARLALRTVKFARLFKVAPPQDARPRAFSICYSEP